MKHCFCQQDQEFQLILDNISTGDSTLCDYKTLAKRFTSKVKESKDFNDALHLFATKKEVFEYNNCIIIIEKSKKWKMKRLDNWPL